jgi:hypothetical protein
MDLVGEVTGEEAREWHGPGLMRLRSPDDDPAADVRVCPPDIDTAAAQVHITYTQRGRFAPAQAAVCKQEDEQPPGAARFR